jgi:hypothetical protein
MQPLLVALACKDAKTSSPWESHFPEETRFVTLVALLRVLDARGIGDILTMKIVDGKIAGPEGREV